MNITHPPISVEAFNHLGLVTLPGGISTPGMAKVIDALSALHSCYHYSELRLRLLDNQGGQITALNSLCAELQTLAGFGVVVSTEGIGLICSAAAVVLSMGTLGHRRVDPGALLVYHLSRTGVSEGVTAKIARQINDRLTLADQSMIQRLAAHILPLTYRTPADGGSDLASWQWPLNPIAREGVLKHAQVTPQRFDSAKACQAFIESQLTAILEADSIMTIEQAIALGLIDESVHVGSAALPH